MIKNYKFFSLFAITLMVALLLSMSGKATSVYALADPVQSIAPIYDTQIYQLQDYIDNGGLSSGQLDIFYTLAGFYVLGQAGSNGYRLVDPYSNSDSVWDWLKSCGIEVYNTIIGLVPDTARMPITGELYSTIPFKKASQLYVATLMGAAVKAATFSSYEDFKTEVINSQSYYLPWNIDVQKGMNSIFGIYGGIYDWQFMSEPWTTNFSWISGNISNNAFENYTSGFNHPLVYCNRTSPQILTDCAASNIGEFSIFVNTSNNKVYFVNSSGTIPSTTNSTGVCYSTYHNRSYTCTARFEFYQYTYDPANINNYKDLINSILNTQNITLCRVYFDNGAAFGVASYPRLTDMFEHVYVGNNWLDKHEIFNLADLNFDDSDQNYYKAVPEEHNYLIDIKGILQDILNNTDLFNTFVNNLVDVNGVPVHDDDLISITTDIYELLEITNPIMPVNLNDISGYTNNTYLDLVKQHGQNFGETIGEYVAFWHNTDPEITYVIFGALILTLVGAFIGKWGHS